MRVLLILVAALLAPVVSADPGYEDVRDLLVRGRYADAEAAAVELLERTEASHGSDSIEAARAIDLLAEAQWRYWKGSAETIALAERAVAIKERKLGERHSDVADSLTQLAQLHLRLQHKDTSLELHERALAIRIESLGVDHPDVAQSLNFLAQRKGMSFDQHDEARTMLERALEINRVALGPEDLAVATSLRLLGDLLEKTGDYEGAEAALREAVRIRERSSSPDHPELALAINNLALVQKRVGDYAVAKAGFERAAAIWERALGPDHPAVAAGLGNLSSMLVTLDGDIPRAIELSSRVHSIFEAWYGADHEMVGMSFHAMAVRRRELGEYDEAANLAERALAVRERVLGPDHSRVAETLIMLGGCLEQLGDLAGAEVAFGRALDIFESVFGPEHYWVNAALASQAGLQLRKGDARAAVATYERSLQMFDASFEEDHPDRAYVLHGLASAVWQAEGNLERALDLHRRALAIREGALAPQHRLIAGSMEQLAEVLIDSGEFDEAARLLERAASIREQSLGRRHPDRAVTLHRLAEAHARAGRRSAALSLALEADGIVREHQRLVARGLSEDAALRYADTRPRTLDLALSLAESSSPEGAVRAWEALIDSRTLVLNEMVARSRVVHAAGDERTVRFADAYRATTSRLAAMVVRGPQEMSAERYRSLVDRLRREAEEAETALARSVGSFRDHLDPERVGLSDLRRAIPADAALVSFARFRRVPSSELAFAAFVLSRERTVPTFIALGNADRIDGLVSRWRREAMRPPSSAETGDPLRGYLDAGGALRERVWDPVAEHLGEARQVLIVPDGSLQLVNFATLPFADRRYLVEAGPRIHYLSAEKGLLGHVDVPRGTGGLLALGGVDFEARAGHARDGAGGNEPPPASATFRGERSACGEFSEVRFDALPGSADEAAAVLELWRVDDESGGAENEPVLLLGPRATETAFKSLAPGRRAIHLATHGFSVSGLCASPRRSGERGLGVLVSGDDGRPSAGRFENPLRLSGLALAGANRRSDAGPGEEDGILTAEEIALLDLSGVQWAVLSACQSGVGDIRSGEGVFGLRRAFRIAGAGTLIVSLWAVDDAAAVDWMRELYAARFKGGMATDHAVREATVATIEMRRRAGESDHPYFWGAFIASGEWR